MGRESAALPDPVNAYPFPAELAGWLSARAWRRLPGGGTPAELWRVERTAGHDLVVKVLHHGAGLVDGHDAATFALKGEQIARVRRDLPDLRPHYVELVGTWRARTWSACAMPLYEGRPPCAWLANDGSDQAGFTETLRPILRVLTERGYAARSRAAPPEHARTVHLERMARRLPLLRAHLDPALFESRAIVVNGRPCLPAAATVEQCLGSRRLHAEMRPGALHYPVHGDLNLGNVLVAGGERPAAGCPQFVVLDPRGTLDAWDVVYDMAKMLFSLTAYDLAMQGGLSIARDVSRGTVWYTVGLRGGSDTGYERAALAFPELLASLPFVRAELARREGDRWRRRLLFSLACDLVAEAACRLSDRKPRTFGPVSGWAACQELATGFYLLGSLLLAEFVAARDLGDPEALLPLAIPAGHRSKPPAP